jgi:hypothetical protein
MHRSPVWQVRCAPLANLRGLSRSSLELALGAAVVVLGVESPPAPSSRSLAHELIPSMVRISRLPAFAPRVRHDTMRRSPARPDVTAQAFLNGRACSPARTPKVRKRGPSECGEVRLLRYDARRQRTPRTAEPAHGLHLKTANSREPTRNRRRSLASGRGPERGNGIPGPKACRPLHDRICAGATAVRRPYRDRDLAAKDDLR